MTKVVEYHEITNEQIDAAFDKLKERVKKAVKRKGRYPFASRLEVFGKLNEEMHEVLQEVHKKDWKKFDDELLDVATVCIWSLAAQEQHNGN